MAIKKTTFGVLPNGDTVELYTVSNGEISLSVSTLGATITSLIVPSRKYGKADIVLGRSDFSGYADNRYFFGATVGRYANRIIDGKFTLNGETYQLSKNKPDCSLHGGKIGFARKIWEAEAYEDTKGTYIVLRLESPNGDQGYPGDMTAQLIFGVTDDNRLVAEQTAKVNRPCPVSISNHTYFNLAGENSGETVLNHELKLCCSSMVEVDDNILPTGRLVPVADTAYDFTRTKKIGRDISAVRQTMIGGYDHCFAIDGENGILRPFAELTDPDSGRCMRGCTTLPGVQVYTANMLPELRGKYGALYGAYSGICLESQNFPDGPNRPTFPDCIYGPDRDYRARTEFLFTW